MLCLFMVIKCLVKEYAYISYSFILKIFTKKPIFKITVHSISTEFRAFSSANITITVTEKVKNDLISAEKMWQR